MIRMRGEWVGGLGPHHGVRRVRDTLASSIKAGVTAATNGLKEDFRAQIRDMGLGNRLANAVGSKVYPERGKSSLHPAGFVFPRGKSATDIFDALNEGAPITARNRRYLAVPTANARLGGRAGKRPTPAEFERHTGIKLRAVKAKRSGALLLMGPRFRGRTRGSSGQDVVYFVLVRQVRPGARLTFEAFARRWSDRIPQLIDRATPQDA